MKRLIISATAILFAASTAHAASLSFLTPDWVDQTGATSPVQYDVVIDDETTAGAYHVDVSVNTSTGQTGDALLFAFNSIFDEANDFNISNFTSNTGDSITDVCYGQIGCNGSGGSNGGGGNFGNGNAFDMIIRIGTKGSSSGLNTAFSFDLTYVGTGFASLPGLQGFTFSRAGMRVQSVGGAPTGGGASLKIFNDDPVFEDPNIVGDVPLPAAGWMLLAGLGGMAAMRRRREKV